jgi:hypothetical protein
MKAWPQTGAKRQNLERRSDKEIIMKKVISVLLAGLLACAADGEK